MSLPHLTEDDLAALPITAAQVTAMLARLIEGAAAGQVQAAPKAVLLPPDGRYIMATLASMDEPALVATKSLVLNAENSARGLPQIDGLVSLLDGQTGAPLATMDGKWITGIRTAGLSALAAQYMARPEARSIAFIGTGLQARTHLDLFAQIFPLKEVFIAGRGQANIDRLASAAEALGLSATTCTPQEAVEAADIVLSTLTHTAVEKPFLDASALRAGGFLCSVDLGVPWLPDSFAAMDAVVVDDAEQEAQMPTKLAPPEHVKGDLGDLVAGRLTPRKEADARTAFVFRGHALGDLALAALAWQASRG